MRYQKKGKFFANLLNIGLRNLDVPNHFVERKSDTEIVVRKLNMLPIECVVRGYFYGSLVSRWKDGKISLEDGTQTDLALNYQTQFLILPLNQRMTCQ